MGDNYKYVKIESNLYSCVQQNSAILAWLLYMKGKPIGFRQGGLTGTLKSLRRISGYVKKHIEYRNVLNNTSVLELPFYGHLCIEVGRGFKIFDLRRQTVTKMFKAEIDEDIVVSEIKSARNIGHYSFAPSILNWSVKKRWYEEEFVNDYRISSSESNVIMNTYYSDIAPTIENMILCGTQKETNVSEYIKNMIDKFYNGLRKEDLDAREISRIKGFIKSASDKIFVEDGNHIYLGLSHGDFGHNHVIRSKRGIKIIDWEYIGLRSILFDFFNCFFVQSFLRHKIHDLELEINNALSSLQSRLNIQEPKMAKNLVPLAQLYRWVFYIERVCSIIELRGLDLGCMTRWIDVFEQHEKKLNQVYEKDH